MKRPQMYLCKYGIMNIEDPSLFSGTQSLFHCKKNKVFWIFKRKTICPNNCPYFTLKSGVRDQLAAIENIARELKLEKAIMGE